MIKLLLISLIMAPILGIVAQLLTKVKIPYIIGLILIGLAFGTEGIYNIFANGVIDQSITTYTAIVAINIVFFTGGYNMDMEKVIKAGKVTGQMVVFPVHAAAIVSGVIGYFILLLFGLNSQFDISIFGMLAVAAPVAMGSLVLVVPTILSLKKPTENDLGNISIATSILDNYSILPFFFIMIVVGAAVNSGKDLNLLGLLLQIIAVALIVCLVTLYGYVMGRLLGKITKSLQQKRGLYTILSFTAAALVANSLMLVSPALVMFGILCALGFGVGIGESVEKEEHPVLGATISKGLGLFMLPIIFVGIGAGMRLSQLLDAKMLIFMTIFAVISIATKLMITKLILKKNGYNDGEQKIAMLCQSLYGAAAINMSIALVPFFALLGEPDGPILMGYLGVFLYIVCLPIGNFITNKYLDKWNA